MFCNYVEVVHFLGSQSQISPTVCPLSPSIHPPLSLTNAPPTVTTADLCSRWGRHCCQVSMTHADQNNHRIYECILRIHKCEGYFDQAQNNPRICEYLKGNQDTQHLYKFNNNCQPREVLLDKSVRG